MSIAHHILRFLRANGVAYEEHPHKPTLTLEEAAAACNVSVDLFLRAVVLSDGQQMFLAVLPLNGALDLERVCILLKKDVQPLTRDESRDRFNDCELGTHPPLGEPYGLKTIVDEQITELGKVYFEAGSHDTVVSMSGTDFLFLSGKALRGAISMPIPSSNSQECRIESDDMAEQFSKLHMPSEQDVQRKLEQVYRLPAIPAVATQILQLVADPAATSKDLAELVEMDPSIAAQVIRYGRSSFFGYRGNVDSIQTAITRVLGFDIVSNLALGIAAGKAFKLAADGPLGLDAFWKHAVHNAALVQSLTRIVNRSLGIKPGTAYLCGLLHNFGVLLLGHLFQPEYYLLNKLCMANPGCDLPGVEKRLMHLEGGQIWHRLSHIRLGAWLMRHWKMPEEVIVVTEYHHDSAYTGEAKHYVALVQLANTMLAQDGVGDCAPGALNANALADLGITEEQARAVYEQLRAGADELDRMAKIMTGSTDSV